MLTKRTGNEEEGTAPVDLNEILDLPHLDKIRQQFTEKLSSSTLQMTRKTLEKRETGLSITLEDEEAPPRSKSFIGQQKHPILV